MSNDAPNALRESIVNSLPDLIDASRFELQGMEGLSKGLISKVEIDNGLDYTHLIVDHLVTKETPFTELFNVGELGETPDRSRFATDIAWLYMFHHNGEIFKSISLKDLKMIGSRIVLDALKPNSLSLQLTYTVDRMS